MGDCIHSISTSYSFFEAEPSGVYKCLPWMWRGVTEGEKDGTVAGWWWWWRDGFAQP